jgi:hypothetical protein
MGRLMDCACTRHRHYPRRHPAARAGAGSKPFLMGAGVLGTSSGSVTLWDAQTDARFRVACLSMIARAMQVLGQEGKLLHSWPQV